MGENWRVIFMRVGWWNSKTGRNSELNNFTRRKQSEIGILEVAFAIGFSCETDSFRKRRLAGLTGAADVFSSRRRKTRAVRKRLILYGGTFYPGETKFPVTVGCENFVTTFGRRRKWFVCGRRNWKNHQLTWTRATAATVATARNIFLLATMFVFAAIWTGFWKRIRRNWCCSADEQCGTVDGVAPAAVFIRGPGPGTRKPRTE